MEVVKAQSKKVVPWGIDEYKAPKCDSHNYRSPSAMMTKSNVPDFLTELQKNKRDLPSPDKYSKLASFLTNGKSNLPKLKR